MCALPSPQFIKVQSFVGETKDDEGMEREAEDHILDQSLVSRFYWILDTGFKIQDSNVLND